MLLVHKISAELQTRIVVFKRNIYKLTGSGSEIQNHGRETQIEIVVKDVGNFLAVYGQKLVAAFNTVKPAF